MISGTSASRMVSTLPQHARGVQTTTQAGVTRFGNNTETPAKVVDVLRERLDDMAQARQAERDEAEKQKEIAKNKEREDVLSRSLVTFRDKPVLVLHLLQAIFDMSTQRKYPWQCRFSQQRWVAWPEIQKFFPDIEKDKLVKILDSDLAQKGLIQSKDSFKVTNYYYCLTDYASDLLKGMDPDMILGSLKTDEISSESK